MDRISQYAALLLCMVSCDRSKPDSRPVTAVPVVTVAYDVSDFGYDAMRILYMRTYPEEFRRLWEEQAQDPFVDERIPIEKFRPSQYDIYRGMLEPEIDALGFPIARTPGAKVTMDLETLTLTHLPLAHVEFRRKFPEFPAKEQSGNSQSQETHESAAPDGEMQSD